MEDVIGGHGVTEDFARFLAAWDVILARRVDEAVASLAAVDGVRGLILAGGLGRGAPWPLSDIDLLPIYADRSLEAARQEVAWRRAALLAPWIAEGWWTGLDIGKLAFGEGEVRRVLDSPGAHFSSLLQDERWYHALDKGYQGRALYDPDGIAGALAAWFTAHRYHPQVVAYRLANERHELVLAQCRLQDCVDREALAEGTVEIRAAVKWLQTWQLERWGERDNSQGRIGTRFAELAERHGFSNLVTELHILCDLDDASVWRRLADAPAWVHERHDRSFRARQSIGEVITRLDDARDTLRVCALYAMRGPISPPYPAWLAISPHVDILAQKAEQLDQVIRELAQPEASGAC